MLPVQHDIINEIKGQEHLSFFDQLYVVVFVTLQEVNHPKISNGATKQTANLPVNMELYFVFGVGDRSPSRDINKANAEGLNIVCQNLLLHQISHKLKEWQCR
jgi:hypothetical protein